MFLRGQAPSFVSETDRDPTSPTSQGRRCHRCGTNLRASSRLPAVCSVLMRASRGCAQLMRYWHITNYVRIDQKETFAAALILRVADILLGPHQNGQLTARLFFASTVIDKSYRVNIIDPSVGAIITTLPTENVYELGFSPKGTFVITWQRPSKDEAGDAVKNLKVWRVIDEASNGDDSQRETVGKFVQKSQTGWNFQYTFDEQYCARVVTNQVQIYESSDLTKVWNRIHVEGVADFSVSPGKNHSIAVFVPERKVCATALCGKVHKSSQNLRGNLQLSRYSTYHNLTLLSRRRASSRVIKSSSNGTMLAQV